MKTGHYVVATLLVLGTSAILTVAQDAAQQDSLAAAARRAREAKKTQPAPTKVYTNDNLPTNAVISYVGQVPATPAATDTANQPAGGAPAGGAAAGANAGNSVALTSAQAQLAAAKKELQLDQRKFALDQQTYLSNPNRENDTDGAASLQSEQDVISAKQDEVDAAQKVVDDLQTKMGVTAPTAPPAQDSSSSPASSSGGSTQAQSTTPSNPAGPTDGPGPSN